MVSFKAGMLSLCLQKKHSGGIMFFIFRLLIHMVAILIISYLLPGLIRWRGVGSPGGCVSPGDRQCRSPAYPDLLFTLPITVLTFGLFLLVINGLMLLLVSSIVSGFHVNGFWGAVLGSILISLVSWVLSRFLPS